MQVTLYLTPKSQPELIRNVFLCPGGGTEVQEGVWRGGVEARALSVADMLGRMQHAEQDATATPAYSLEVK